MSGDIVTVPSSVDWQQVVLAIRRHYKPLATVAKEVGSDWQHICRLSRGDTHEPKYSVALKLLDIYKEHCNKGECNASS